MNEFLRDNAWQQSVRDEVLAPGFYGQHAYMGRYVLIDKGRLASVLQKRFAVDTIVQARDGRAICIEEKIVRWPGYHYRFFCLETHSCTRKGYESDGWMRYGEADYLLYCFEQECGGLSCYLIDFPALKTWFWPLEDIFKEFGPLPTFNATMGRLVPITVVQENVRTWHFTVSKKFAPAGTQMYLYP
jgi:hypothetical protein